MTQSLFKRLGGDKGISKIVDNTSQLRMCNSAFNPRFLPLKNKPKFLAIIKRHAENSFIAGIDGSVEYKEIEWFLPIQA